MQLFSLVVATQRSRHSTRVKKMFDYILEKIGSRFLILTRRPGVAAR